MVEVPAYCLNHCHPAFVKACDSCTGNSTIGHAKSRRAHDIQIHASGPLGLHVCPLCPAAPFVLSISTPLAQKMPPTQHQGPNSCSPHSPPQTCFHRFPQRAPTLALDTLLTLTPRVTFTAKANERIAPKCHFPRPPSPASAHPLAFSLGPLCYFSLMSLISQKPKLVLQTTTTTKVDHSSPLLKTIP